MFQRRLWWFSMLLVGLALAIIGRLAQIQIINASQYQQLSTRLLTRPARYIAAPRGALLDRNGVVLVCDEPASDVAIYYPVLAGRKEQLWEWARAAWKRGDYPNASSVDDVFIELHAAVADTWRRLAELTGESVADFMQRRDRILANVARVADSYRRRSGSTKPIAEEALFHPLAPLANDAVALAIRLELERYPWIRVVPSTRRSVFADDSLVHVLGRMGAASPEMIAADPLADDELRGLRAGDRCGVSGVERVGEPRLRGTRGRVVQDENGDDLERADAVKGDDLRLTIDSELQRDIFGWLDEAVKQVPTPSGASVVVIDAATREVLALASYPTYSREEYERSYAELVRDARRMPLTFRAVQAQYPPGSTCKAITLMAGLGEGVITASTRFRCTGFLLPTQPHVFRCWIYNQFPGVTHDMKDGPAGQDAELAIKNSCNIYFYHVGERAGPAKLCEWFERFGFGRAAGTGLIEESPGIVPTAEWLRENDQREYQAADAWNFAIGQGEVTCTPLQAANAAASIAAGRWAPVRLVVESEREAQASASAGNVPFAERDLRVLRSGMWRVVNDSGGTAHEARLDSKTHELCGKTGSAQASPRATQWRYICEWPDGSREDVFAMSEAEALAQFGDFPPRIVGRRVSERYPAILEGEKLPAHAWFVGFTQAKSTPRGQTPQGKVYGISVLIEFGGSGGKVAAPLAKRIAERLVEGSAAKSE
ncbi:Stage V sporulation protein D [Phycisphaerae bacterium RAS1]|nr:Stage V sporulation protein D [Phycisphaerae bacterium RAS1]